MTPNLEVIINHVKDLTRQHTSFQEWRETKMLQYVDGLRYDQVKQLKISKSEIAQYFMNPKTREPIAIGKYIGFLR